MNRYFLFLIMILFCEAHPLSFGSTEIVLGTGHFLDFSYPNVDSIDNSPSGFDVIDLYIQYLFDAGFLNIGGEIGAIWLNRMDYYIGSPETLTDPDGNVDTLSNGVQHLRDVVALPVSLIFEKRWKHSFLQSGLGYYPFYPRPPLTFGISVSYGLFIPFYKKSGVPVVLRGNYIFVNGYRFTFSLGIGIKLFK